MPQIGGTVKILSLNYPVKFDENSLRWSCRYVLLIQFYFHSYQSLHKIDGLHCFQTNFQYSAKYQSMGEEIRQRKSCPRNHRIVNWEWKYELSLLSFLLARLNTSSEYPYNNCLEFIFNSRLSYAFQREQKNWRWLHVLWERSTSVPCGAEGGRTMTLSEVIILPIISLDRQASALITC